jgi:phosphohistidine phosphatase
MKTLHLLRHAKSSWKDRGLDDRDRPLSKRCRETARAIAAYLRRAKIAPDLVICSTAVRARQTLDPIAKAIKPPKVILEREIYEVAQKKYGMEAPLEASRERGLRASDRSQSRSA